MTGTTGTTWNNQKSMRLFQLNFMIRKGNLVSGTTGTTSNNKTHQRHHQPSPGQRASGDRCKRLFRLFQWLFLVSIQLFTLEQPPIEGLFQRLFQVVGGCS